MSCENHVVAINERTGELHCPLCGHTHTDEEAKQYLFKEFRNPKSVEFTFSVFNLARASIETANPEEKKQLKLQLRKLTNEFNN